MMNNSFIRLAVPGGKRAPKVVSRAMVYVMCLTLVLTGVMPPGLGLAQVTVDQVTSLKEVPVPVPTAAVIPVDPAKAVPSDSIPGPGTNLNFQDLIAAGIVKDQAALLSLGKALFWDMQVGSDGVQSCATCHYNAGADIRSQNSISPGLKDTNFNGPIGGDNNFGNSTCPFTATNNVPPPAGQNALGHTNFKPNLTLKALDFPLNEWFQATALVPRGPGVTVLQELSGVSKDANDVISSQGVRHTKFVGVSGSAVDFGSKLYDIFNTKTPGQLRLDNRQRRVEPRNAPTMINAVFNFDNFWDGRASYVFNGANPFGYKDQVSTLKVKMTNGVPDPNGTLTDVFLRVLNSSLASQAVGPPGSNFEMSWEGRSWPNIGKKMVSLKPLAKQLVHPQDSVLGPFALATLNPDGSASGTKGLNFATYADMVKAAFQDQWWNDGSTITIASATAKIKTASADDPRTYVLYPGKATATQGKATIAGGVTTAALTANEFTQMQFNFSMFFGLAVQAYEATLISDDTPFDRFMGANAPLDRTTGATLPPIPPDPNALTSQQRVGFAIFNDTDPVFGAKCVTCHVPPVTTGHTVLDNQPDAQGVPSVGGPGEAVETMVMGDGRSANYDHGMYNISVRRTTEDLGRAGTSPFTNPLTGQPFPLSLTELAALRSAGQLPPDVARFIPSMPVLDRRVTNGTFKVPVLRNAKLTGPYFHNGDSSTLRQVVEFYTRGGNFPNTNFADLAPDIIGIPDLMFPDFDPIAQQNIQSLVDFLAEGLLDQRVVLEKAPFDHPQLLIPHGSATATPDVDLMGSIAACGANGHTFPIKPFLNLNPQQP